MRRSVVALFILMLSLATAAASWRDDLTVLRVGFIAGDNPSQEVARLEKFRARLQYGLAVPVVLFPARSYQALIEAMSSGRIQYAVLSSLAFVALDQDCHCAEPLVQPVGDMEAQGFRALIVAPADGPVASLEEARGMRFAVGRADSLSGRLVPLAGLGAEGIDADSYFASMVETDDALAALKTLASGNADIAVAWTTAEDPLNGSRDSGPVATLAAEGGLPAAGLRVIWESDLVPFGPHVVRTDLPAEAKAALRETLLTMQDEDVAAYDAIEPQFSGGFIAADPASYRRLGQLLAEITRPQ